MEEIGFLKNLQRSGVTQCILLLAVITFYEYSSISESLSSVEYENTGNPYLTLYSVLSIVLLSLLSFSKDFRVWQGDRLARCYSHFMAFSFAISFLFFITGLRHYNISAPFKWISPLFVFWAIYYLTYKIGEIQLMSKFVLLMMVALIYGYYVSYEYILGVALQQNIHQQLISSYFALYLLPLVLCIDSKLTRFIAIATVAIVLLSSAKRAGTIAFVIAVFVYYLTVLLTTEGRYKIWQLLLFVIGIAVFLWGIDYLFQNSDLYIIERLNRLEMDEGSGRVELYRVVFNMIGETDFIGLVLGHGFSAVGLDSPMHMGAHNDFLEVIYDYGIVGLFLYVMLHVLLIKYVIRLIKDKSRFAASMAMSYTLFLILSLVSQIVIYPFFEILFAIVWASIMASRKREINDKRIVVHSC